MISEILGKKLGMTQVYDAQNVLVPVTVVEAGPCAVVQVKTLEPDGYNAVQIGFSQQKEKNTAGGEFGHAAEAVKRGARRLPGRGPERAGFERHDGGSWRRADPRRRPVLRWSGDFASSILAFLGDRRRRPRTGEDLSPPLS